MDPSDILAASHRASNRDRTIVGTWYADLSAEDKDRFDEFVEAFRANPRYRLPTFLGALHGDQILGDEGAAFPHVTSESLGKFISRYRVAG